MSTMSHLQNLMPIKFDGSDSAKFINQINELEKIATITTVEAFINAGCDIDSEKINTNILRG